MKEKGENEAFLSSMHHNFSAVVDKKFLQFIVVVLEEGDEINRASLNPRGTIPTPCLFFFLCFYSTFLFYK